MSLIFLRIIALLLAMIHSWTIAFRPLFPHPSSKQPPYFEPASCMVDLPTGIENENVECGYLVVPELHNQPQGRTIRLAVIILKSRSTNPRPDPLVMLQGGPGGSTIETYTKRLLNSSRLLTTNRDIILFDQRGTLYSQPALTCPEILDLTIQTLNQDLSTEESLRLYEKVTLDCRERLLADGINLSAYNSFENAADVADLQAALNYPQINLYGVSYGSLLALHVMRFYPEGIRSVILDGVVPPQINFILEAPRTKDQAFTKLFEACIHDTSCNQNYPELEQVFFELVEQLNKIPARLTLVDSESGQEYPAILNGEGLINVLFQMLYVTEVIPAIPTTIYNIRAGKYDFLQRFLGWMVFDRSMSYGMYYSLLCAEDADFDPEQVVLDEIRPELAKYEKENAASFLKVCQGWKVNQLGTTADEPVSSDIPTLVLSGAFDPITPPNFANAAAITLSHSYSYVFPNTGHGAALTGECPDQIILEFLENPQKKPNSTCVSKLKPPEFFTPDRVVLIPSMGNLINLEDKSSFQILCFLAATLFLLTPWLIWPTLWFVQKVTRKPKLPIQKSGRLVKWLSLITGSVLLAFFITLSATAVRLAFENNYVIFFGLPVKYRPLFVIPPIATLITTIMFGVSIKTWFSRYGALGERIYYTALVFASLVCLIILASWQMLFVFL